MKVHACSWMELTTMTHRVCFVSTGSREEAKEMMAEEAQRMLASNPQYTHMNPSIGIAGFNIFKNNRMVWKFRLQTQDTI